VSSTRRPNPAARRGTKQQQAAKQAAARRRTLLLGVAGGVALLVIIGVLALVLKLNRGGDSSVAAAAPVDGVQCGATEGQTQHIHQHLDIVVNGQYQTIPANVGIILTKGCLYWMHTHTPDGVIHIEAPVKDHLMLVTFFDIWSVSQVDRTALNKVLAGPPDRILLDGKPYTGDYRMIPLQSHTLVTLEYGSPDTPQRPFDFVAAGLPT
jgi:hypothetical protein